MTADLSSEPMQVRRQWSNIFKVSKYTHIHTHRVNFWKQKWNKNFLIPKKAWLNEFMKPALQEMLKEVYSGRRKMVPDGNLDMYKTIKSIRNSKFGKILFLFKKKSLWMTVNKK